MDWTSYNYPSSISTSGESVQFSYGPWRQRWQQNYNSGTEVTEYVGGLLEHVFSGGTNTYRHYIYAGNEPVAVYSRTSTLVNTWSYFLTDQQGSVAAITNSSGAVDVNESFSAFGARRNPTSWSGAPISGDLTTIAGLSRQGYTFQTALGQSMGLNHMNGRVQDAITGRFLSPDPYIPYSNRTQSYNRFGYVENKPLTYTDPSGFQDGDDGTLDDIIISWTYSGSVNAATIPYSRSDGGNQPPLYNGLSQVVVSAARWSNPLDIELDQVVITAMRTGARQQHPSRAVCTALAVAVGAVSGAAGGAVTGGVLGGGVGAGVGAIAGAALGIAGALMPQGGFGGGALGAVITLIFHTASGTNLGAFTQVLTDTAGGVVGDNPAASIAVGAAGGAASEAYFAVGSVAEIGAAAAEGGVAGFGGAATAAITNRTLTALIHSLGCQ